MSNMSHFRTILIALSLIPTVSWSRDHCPSPCECKWKKGKETLSCENANFRQIPTMPTQSGIQVLEFSGNRLKMLRNDVFFESNLLNLQEVSLSSCELERIERFSFRDLINLVRLDLSYNSLSTVPKASLSSLTQLMELQLSGNPIRKIKNYSFSSLTQMVKLELSDCRLEFIEPFAFVGLEQLRRLKIDRNFLTELNPTVLSPLKDSLYGLALHQNPWNCTCALRPIIEWLQRFNVPPTIPPVCASPVRIRHQSWTDLKSNSDFACPPSIISLTRITTSTSNITKLSCKVRADPTARITWSWEGSIIRQTQNHIINENTIDGNFVMTSNLTIHEATSLGVYRCIGSNAAGNDSASISLEVGVDGRGRSIIGGTAVTTLHKRSQRSQIYVVGALGTGIVLCLGFLIACCLYRVRRKPESVIAGKHCFFQSNHHHHHNHHQHHNHRHENESSSPKTTAVVSAGIHSEPEENEFFIETEMEPMVKSVELLAMARETEIREPLKEDRIEFVSRRDQQLGIYERQKHDGRQEDNNNDDDNDKDNNAIKSRTFLAEYRNLQLRLSRMKQFRQDIHSQTIDLNHLHNNL